jgi:hypothetical protein
MWDPRTSPLMLNIAKAMDMIIAEGSIAAAVVMEE